MPTIYRAESSGALIRVHPHPPSREIVVAWAAFLLFCPPKSLPRAGLSSFPVPIFLKCAGLSSLLLDCLLFFVFGLTNISVSVSTLPGVECVSMKHNIMHKK